MDDWKSICRRSCARGLEAELFVECLDVWKFYPNCLVFQAFQVEREPETVGCKRPSRRLVRMDSSPRLPNIWRPSLFR
jgi:hypothetical protein